MSILAIDPGYGRCGVAIVERNGYKERVIHSDCIETSSKDDFSDRLSAVIDHIDRLISAHSPTQLAIEKLFFSNNQKTAMRVSEVRGAIIGLAGLRDIPVFEYTPAQIKNAAAGWGGADKKQVIKMIHALVVIDKKIQYDDEYDAIAVGITHFAHYRK